MFRVKDGKDVSNEEFDSIVDPFTDLCSNYLIQELIPKYIAFHIAEGYRTSAIWSNSYDIIFNTAMDMFNIIPKNVRSIKDDVAKLLEKEYKLKIISEDPLDLKEL